MLRDDVLEKMSEQELQLAAREILLRLDGKTAQNTGVGSVEWAVESGRAAAGFGDWVGARAGEHPAVGGPAGEAIRRGIDLLLAAAESLQQATAPETDEERTENGPENGAENVSEEEMQKKQADELPIPVRRGKRMEASVPTAVSRAVETRDRQIGAGKASTFSVGRVSACLQKDARRYDSGYIRY